MRASNPCIQRLFIKNLIYLFQHITTIDKADLVTEIALQHCCGLCLQALNWKRLLFENEIQWKGSAFYYRDVSITYLFFDTKKEFLVCFKYISTKKEKADKGTEELQAQNQYKKIPRQKKSRWLQSPIRGKHGRRYGNRHIESVFY